MWPLERTVFCLGGGLFFGRHICLGNASSVLMSICLSLFSSSEAAVTVGTVSALDAAPSKFPRAAWGLQVSE